MTHPSYDPNAGHATVGDLEAVINESLAKGGREAWRAFASGLATALYEECERHEDAGSGDQLYWGEDCDGRPWHVRLVR